MAPATLAARQDIPLSDRVWFLVHTLWHLDEDATRRYARETALAVARLMDDDVWTSMVQEACADIPSAASAWAAVMVTADASAILTAAAVIPGDLHAYGCALEEAIAQARPPGTETVHSSAEDPVYVVALERALRRALTLLDAVETARS
jgi:hypothetical protein